MVVENAIWHELFTTEELNRARERLKQYGYIRKAASDPDLMRMWPISNRDNKPENDDPSIVEPIELATDAA